MQHENMIRDYEYHTSIFSRTFDCYDYVDCFNYMNLHDQLKLYKHGFSKVTDHACREIRHGRITREEGLILVKKHEQAVAEYTQLFLEWLGVNKRSLQFIIDQHRNPRFWNQPTFGSWEFNGLSFRHGHYDAVCDKLPEASKKFKVNNSLETNRPPEYITIGKGFQT